VTKEALKQLGLYDDVKKAGQKLEKEIAKDPVKAATLANPATAPIAVATEVVKKVVKIKIKKPKW
jgi:hypothetical protein